MFVLTCDLKLEIEKKSRILQNMPALNRISDPAKGTRCFITSCSSFGLAFTVTISPSGDPVKP